ncbi:MAG: hypothetical protein B7C24_00260 [Bacteroidetes bacterium 4572_77]|nr:MAG: hypothetical protein B7C24_00260 [Bacteroidetes bacterium 4572_77]
MKNDFIYEKEVTSDKNLEQSLRKSINDWVNNKPHHPYKNLGNKIKIKSIWYKPAYPVVLRTQYEERSKNKDHEPFTNQNIPTRKFYELSDFNSWDISLKKINDFEDSTKKYYVNGSQYVEDCFHCGAKGSVICNTCNGAKKITCPDCGGSTKVTCSSCSGSGTYSCDRCSGTGYTQRQVARQKEVYVRNPDGDGGRYHTKTYYETINEPCTKCGRTGRLTCTTCQGQGKVNCQRCRATGRIQCPTCLGTGRLVCPICDGKTQLMHHFYIERKLEYTHQNTCVIQGDIYERFPEFLEEFPNYESKNVFSNKADSLETNQLPDDHHLNSFIDKFIDKADKEETDFHSLQFQQLDISCIDTWELTYQFNGKEYVMAFTGSEFEIIPGLSPVYEVAFEYWRKGISAKEWMMFSRSSRLLTKASKIDVFELKEKVEFALDLVKTKLNQSYSLGATIALWIIAFFGGFAAYTYYSEVNYMFDYVAFINNPDGFLYAYHAWAQTIFSVFLVLMAYITAVPIVQRLGHYIPTAILRIGLGLIVTALIALLYLSLWALLNATGISIIITFFIWLALKIIGIIWWIIKLILGIIIWLAMIAWSIIIWIWNLIF